MFCTKCGNEVKEGAAFCTTCGEPVKATEVEETAAPVEETAAPVEESAPAPVNAAPVNVDNGTVGFVEAIKLLFKNYANFTGRTTRSEYWWAFLFLWLVNLAASYIPVVGGIVSLALLIPNLSLNIRRLHDIGKSWPWILMGLIPLVGIIILIVYYCRESDGDNQWGAAR